MKPVLPAKAAKATEKKPPTQDQIGKETKRDELKKDDAEAMQVKRESDAEKQIMEKEVERKEEKTQEDEQKLETKKADVKVSEEHKEAMDAAPVQSISDPLPSSLPQTNKKQSPT
jgi:hypothetical protein